jgi:heme exporter protein C
MIFRLISSFLSLELAYLFCQKAKSWLLITTIIFICSGTLLGLFWAPPDYQQGDAFRIIYVHVPSAWMSLFVYLYMVLAAVVALVWKIKVAEVGLRAAAPIGMIFTFLALITGSIWGKPMWGTWWVWDARLTSELILLFIYLGIMGLFSAIDDPRTGSRAGAVMTLIGAINIPIIHYSVEWWNTLHQGPTVTKFDSPSIELSMLIPLIIMASGFLSYFLLVLSYRIQYEILRYERNANWIRRIVQ